jgi:hypothetical protein
MLMIGGERIDVEMPAEESIEDFGYKIEDDE